MGHVPHLLIPSPWTADTLPISLSSDHHLRRVLRITDGNPVTYTDGHGLTGAGRFVSSAVERGREVAVPPRRPQLTIAVPPPHEKDRLRFLVEKLAELEVRRLCWLRTRYGTRRLPEPSKTGAWSRGALEQSRGAWLMEIEEGWVELTDLAPDSLVADIGAGAPASPLTEALTVAIGPEGGWDPDELPDGVTRFGMGRTVLRVETAAIAAAARFLA